LRTVRRDISARRQLQDGRTLAFAQFRQQDGFSVGELKGIMVDLCLTFVDLPKLRHVVPEPPGKEHTSFASHFFLEGKLGAGTQTDGYITIVGRGKTSRNRVGEACRYQLVADLRWPRRNEF
jgi:hypothetical protein